MSPTIKIYSQQHLAIALSGLANFFLGASSLYWKALSEFSSITLVVYRITLSSAMLALFLLVFRRLNHFKTLTLKLIITHCAAATMIAFNWGAFIWSSINDHLLESGLGYLLAPFISIGMGCLIYHEPITPRKILSTIVALSSVAFLIFLSENLNHWTYLLIATTWGSYTYLKKTTSLDAISGLFIETFFLTVILTFVVWTFDFTLTRPNDSSYQNLSVWLAGVVSVTPLLMFSFATNKIPLSLTGFLQFILPLTLFSIGIIFNKQAIPTSSLTLLMVTAGILATLLAYDISTSTSSKTRSTRDEKYL